ncbi:MAG: CRTAC1 family protein [Planctomycetota bacterium]
MSRVTTPLLAALTFAAPLGAAPQDAPWFTDVTEGALPGVTTTCGARAKAYILEVNGGGVGLGDLDLDGDLDLVVVDGSTLARYAAGEPGMPPRVFLNDGRGHFAPGGAEWRLAAGRWGTGCALGDVDADGDLDLVVTQWGPDQLYLNDGGRGFAAARALTATSAPEWSTSATFLDYDADGQLDLYIAHYLVPELDAGSAYGGSWKGHPVMRGPMGLAPAPDTLLRGRGDGTFADVSATCGLASAAPGFGLGVLTLDADRDGDTDLFVTNDSSPNHLWVNQGDGTFVERGLRLGVSHDGEGRAQASMGIAIGDLDGDGGEDLFVTNFSSEANTLYMSRATGAFRDHSTRRALVAPSVRLLGWGTGLQDVDFDGDLDLWVLNGHVYPEADLAGTDTSYAQPDQLLVQGADGRFAPRALRAGPDDVSRAGAQGDLDGDGDLDLVVMTLDGPVRVLRNDAPRPQGARWLGVRLRAETGNTSGLGARVTLARGAARATRELRGSGGFQAACPVEAHFAWLSDDAAAPLSLDIRWPDGTSQRLDAVAPDQWLTVHRERQGGPR